ncbi:hypothetical protein HDU96_005979 [Phlyctochytrium bullatum]|nr:hypothetical protein HDU96_005979 [Phlyctochytrium bullatum]
MGHTPRNAPIHLRDLPSAIHHVPRTKLTPLPHGQSNWLQIALLSYKDPTKGVTRTWESCERVHRGAPPASATAPHKHPAVPPSPLSAEDAASAEDPATADADTVNPEPTPPVSVPAGAPASSPLSLRRTSAATRPAAASPTRIRTTSSTDIQPPQPPNPGAPPPPRSSASPVSALTLSPHSPIPKTAPRGRFDAVDILATLSGPWNGVDEGPKLILVCQFRAPCQSYVLEMPAGLIDATDTSLESAALRELHEETGFKGRVLSVAPGPCAYEAAMTSSCGVMVRLEAINPQAADATAEEPGPPASPDPDEWSLIPVLAPLRSLPEDLERLVRDLAEAGKQHGVVIDSRVQAVAEGVRFGRLVGGAGV